MDTHRYLPPPKALDDLQLGGHEEHPAARAPFPRRGIELALRASNIGYWDWDLRTDAVHFSPEWKRQLGYADDELVSTWEEWEGRLHPDDRERTLCALHDYLNLNAGEYAVEFRLRHRDGSYRWILTRGELLRGPAGEATRMVGCHVDITKRKELEGQLRQSQKLEAIGRLAGGVAHDFNNLLTGIRGYATLAMGQTSKGTPVHSDLAEVVLLVDRAAGLTRQLLAFSRRQPLQPEVLDLNDLIDGTTRMLARLIGEDIELAFLPTTPIGRVCVDRGQIEQVLLNLAVNARDAMPNGGQLTVETANVNLDEGYVRTHAQAEPGPYAMIAVSDAGCGMDDATQARIFEPFFTTKEMGKGTGLGLATVYGIVKQHNGHIWVYSEPGKGTTFKIYLPRTEMSQPAEEEAGEEPPVHGGSEGVLVVEDEPTVLEITRRSLVELGYQVFCASCPAEAEVLFDAHRDQISLLLTDVVMPGGNGRELHGRLAQLSPGLKVLYTSGYTENAVVHHGALEQGLPFMEKPFDAIALARRVREVLDAA